MNYEAIKGCTIKALKNLGKTNKEINKIIEEIYKLEEQLTEIEAQTIYFEFISEEKDSI